MEVKVGEEVEVNVYVKVKDEVEVIMLEGGRRRRRGRVGGRDEGEGISGNGV